jgi:hypothetical protein
MKRSFLMLLLCSTTIAYSQKIAKPDAYAKTITAADLKKHLYIVAGPEMEGRETATPGQRKAAAYIEDQFKKIGLQPGNGSSYQMMFNVYQDSLVGSNIEVNGHGFQVDRDYNAIVNGLGATMRFSEVVVMGPNTLDSLPRMDLAGKLVLLTSANTQRNAAGQNLTTLLQSKGVAAILTVSSAFPRTTPFNRKSSQTINIFRRTVAPLQMSISSSVARTIAPDYDAVQSNNTIIKSYPANVLLEVRKNTGVVQSSNVLGVLPGTDLKDEYLFITAHYDHLGKRGDSVIYYGADDDGSGTVSLIELAEAFQKAKAEGKGPRRSIVFMAVSGEEKGLWGSEYYASNPVYPLNKTTADLNIDMIGRIDPKRTTGDSTNYVYVVGDDKLSSDLRVISEAMNKKYTKLELDYKYNDPEDKEFIYYRSDHYNFAKNGVPIIFYFNGTHADYHRPTDTPDKITYPLMAKRAQLVFYTAWEMANRNEMLKRDLPLPVLRR